MIIKNRNGKKVVITSLILVAVGLFFNSPAQSKISRDERLAQKSAQHFVRRMQTTRNVSPLIKEMFSPKFIPRYACEIEEVTPTFFSNLTRSEQQRLFIIHINNAYLLGIDIINGNTGSEDGQGRSEYAGILPSTMAENLRNILSNSGRPVTFLDYQDFHTRLPQIEKTLLDASTFVRKSGVEQTSDFQKRLEDRITGKGLQYEVETTTIAEYSTVCPEAARFPAKQKLFYVSTPLFFSIVFLKLGNSMKIIAITDADND